MYRLTSFEFRAERWEWSTGSDSTSALWRTNGRGEGLWAWNPSKLVWDQREGTLQFSLPEPSEEAIERAARDLMSQWRLDDARKKS